MLLAPLHVNLSLLIELRQFMVVGWQSFISSILLSYYLTFGRIIPAYLEKCWYFRLLSTNMSQTPSQDFLIFPETLGMKGEWSMGAERIMSLSDKGQYNEED